MTNLVVKVRFRDGTTLKQVFTLPDNLSTVTNVSKIFKAIRKVVESAEK